jgi:hypothetical protein
MDEIYRMLGREREADLAREAAKLALAAAIPKGARRRPGVRAVLELRKPRRPATNVAVPLVSDISRARRAELPD